METIRGWLRSCLARRMNHPHGQVSIAISIPLEVLCYRYDEGVSNVPDEKVIIAFKVLTSKIPYHYLQREPAIILCIHTGRKPERRHYPVLSNNYWRFMEQCWSAATHDRPSTESVVQMINDALESLPKVSLVQVMSDVSFSTACLSPL